MRCHSFARAPAAVAEAIAAHYGVTKRELLDRDAADLPVRMALGETWVVAETKRALEEAGVDLAKIEVRGWGRHAYNDRSVAVQRL